MNIIFLIILIFTIISIFFYDGYEYFNKIESQYNPFLTKLPNIYYTKQFIENLFVPPKPKIRSLQNIIDNSYIDSNIISTKVICSNINNQGKCWDNNNCQWVEKIGEKSFCTIAPKMLL